ncbi:MAG: hypothetical protein AMS25_04035 [Gemmatimonas sp. SM23_52]|nr:MAG: hypothetical protein AMS25_04035 [Gemmatimonas sp. SM23_52]
MRLQRITALVAGLACAEFSAVPGAAAQHSSAAFDTLTVAVRIVINVNRTTFHRYWDPDPGVELNFETPFYFGRVEAGLHYANFNAERPEQPDFQTLFPYLGWGFDWPVASRLSWYSGIRAGSLFMDFDAPGSHAREQELAVALNSRLRYRPLAAWSLDASVRYRVVFTHERLRHVYIAAGLSRSLTMPRWLREFLD